MKKYYETKEAIKEQKQWAKKLKESGFNDIETGYDKETGYVHKQEFKVELANVVYFEKCSSFLHSGKIKDKLDLFIFEKHCEGLSTRDTEKLLKEFKFRSLDHVNIYRRLIRILASAGIEPITFK